MFLEIFKKKEHAATSHTIVADLIENGSWERDFFTVALRCGDVRANWFQWWRTKQAKDHSKPSAVGETLLLKDVESMALSLFGYLGKARHRATVNDNHGWAFVWRIILLLENLEASAVFHCWIVGHSSFLSS